MELFFKEKKYIWKECRENIKKIVVLREKQDGVKEIETAENSLNGRSPRCTIIKKSDPEPAKMNYSFKFF